MNRTAQHVMTSAAIMFTASMLWTSSAAAQTVFSNSSSSSSSSAEVESSASASASSGSSNAQIYLDQSGPTSVHSQHEYSGSYTMRSAPAVQPPSMGSGHPCALSGSIGFSIIGGGAAGGLSRVDEACLLAQMGQGQAALIMIARRDSEACLALRQVGSLPANSVCSASERRAAARAQPVAMSATTTQTAQPVSNYVTCTRNDDGQIVARKQRGTPYSDQQISTYCRQQLQ